MKKLFLLFVCCFCVFAVDAAGQTILLPIGSGPFASEVTQDGTLAVVANRNNNSVAIINLADNTTKNTITVGSAPISVALNPVTNRAVVANFGSDNVSVIDIGSGTVVATSDVGAKDPSNLNFRYSPRDVAIDTAKNVAIIANLNANSVSLLDLNTNQLLLTTPIGVGAGPISIAYYPEKNVTLVANYGDNTVTVIDMQNNARLREISVGIKPLDIVLNPQTKRAIVVNEDTSDVTVLDLDKIADPAQNPVVTTVSVGNRPFSAVINPNTNIAAVLLNGNKSISLVNLADNTKLTTVISGIGDTPTNIARNPGNNTALIASPANEGIYVVPLGFINYIPFALDTEAFRSNLGITSISTSEANVQIELWDKDGNKLASGTTKVPARGLKQINNVNRFLLATEALTNSTGALRIMSDQPFSSFVSVIDNSTNDPALQIGRSTGHSKLLLNSATNTGFFRSQLVLLNLGSAPTAAVTLTARSNETGEVLATKSDISIPKNGFYIADDVLAALGIQGTFGPLEIESPNIQPLIGISLVGSTNRTSGFLEAVPIQ
jgi:YVTN family beta-propeller protein